jgi:hypothetical protein
MVEMELVPSAQLRAQIILNLMPYFKGDNMDGLLKTARMVEGYVDGSDKKAKMMPEAFRISSEDYSSPAKANRQKNLRHP